MNDQGEGHTPTDSAEMRAEESAESADGADATLREHLDRTHASVEERLQDALQLIDMLCEEHERQRQRFLDHLAIDHAAPAAVVVASQDEAQRAAAEEVQEWHAEAQETLQEAQETLQEARQTAEASSETTSSAETPAAAASSPSRTAQPPAEEENNQTSPTSSPESPQVEILNPPPPVATDEQRQNLQQRAARKRSIANPTARRRR